MPRQRLDGMLRWLLPTRRSQNGHSAEHPSKGLGHQKKIEWSPHLPEGRGAAAQEGGWTLPHLHVTSHGDFISLHAVPRVSRVRAHFRLLCVEHLVCLLGCGVAREGHLQPGKAVLLPSSLHPSGSSAPRPY